MVPKIIFTYSWIYDQNWRKWIKVYKIKAGKYPSAKTTLRYIEKIQKKWKGCGEKVLKELARISKLKWKSRNIYCYVVGKGIPFSDPLTMPIYKNTDYFIDVLVHELIHQLFSQNMAETEEAWRYIDRKYKKESHNTRIHIPLHAIHQHIYLKFFGEKRMKRDIRAVKYLLDYKRAWEIVQKEGYQRIIQEFTKRVQA
jgi:hypothetical protein